MTITLQSPERVSVSYRVLGAASVCHMLNDTMQSLFVAAYPIFKGNFHLSFSQIGALTLVFQITASLLQPLVGLYTDRKPQPYSLPIRHGHLHEWLVHPGVRHELRDAAAGRGLAGRRFVDLPSGNVPARQVSFRRVAWVGAVRLSSWRKLRLVPRAAADDFPGPPQRAAQSRVVFIGGDVGHRDAGRVWPAGTSSTDTPFTSGKPRSRWARSAARRWSERSPSWSC